MMGFDAAIPCFQVPHEQMPDVLGATIFLTSEQDVQNAPPDTRRVGIHHSLPDNNLQRNHANMLAINPVTMSMM
ncbi:hypothetical protein ILP92_16635 [Maribius pontilimi]|uniref:Uncharacterized protein n=1 Tax=Palleronia pontilimi TaxID=1964209 RepID=A0A934ILS3_9RHOB|nr:hypothetical protein [Palleronia pontilimi]MBJ3764369.1 hypothetical protein [Palleronia pontilimi]